jgi:hypothetical protein
MLTTRHPHKLLSTAHLDELLDEALEQTFPASDPIAIAVELEASELKQPQAFELRAAHPPRNGTSGGG